MLILGSLRLTKKVTFFRALPLWIAQSRDKFFAKIKHYFNQRLVSLHNMGNRSWKRDVPICCMLVGHECTRAYVFPVKKVCIVCYLPMELAINWWKFIYWHSTLWNMPKKSIINWIFKTRFTEKRYRVFCFNGRCTLNVFHYKQACSYIWRWVLTEVQPTLGDKHTVK